MKTVVIRLDGALQAWGDQSVFAHRATREHPTKSGVIGLVCAALGRPRDHDPTELAACQFAVRIDQPGSLLSDYHTAGNSGWINTEGKTTFSEPKISEREYLQDAVFTAALATEDDTLADIIAQALTTPVWPLYLGRRSCPPSAPLLIALQNGDALQALTTVTYQGHRTPPPATLTVIHDDPEGSETLNDQPISYGVLTRAYLPRTVTRTHIPTPGILQPAVAAGDPFTEAQW